MTEISNRRRFLQKAAVAGVAASSMRMDSLKAEALTTELKKKGKRVLMLWLAGGASQLETWDPKPGRLTGGPYQAIQTKVSGINISELLPKMSTRLHNTAIIRSLNTQIGDHGGGARLMHLGRRDEPNLKYPDMGSVLARELRRPDLNVPDHVSFYTATEGRSGSIGQPGFLGARYAPMFLTTNNKPTNLSRLENITDLDHKERADLRQVLSKQFSKGRSSQSLDSHNVAYGRVRGLMSSEKLFDLSDEPQKIKDRYGKSLFAQQAMVARRLVEAGTPFVKVGRAWWDSHGQNFETHLELVTELDHVMSTLLDDLETRGLLKDTLVITLAEFGRTPKINGSLGRDHFARAWSCSLTGSGIKGGSVYGATDKDGEHVKDNEIGAAELFATIYKAVGIDPHHEYMVGSRPVPLVDLDKDPVKEVLA